MLRKIQPGVLAGLAILTVMALAQTMHYPQTKKIDHTDTYHGVKVPDPYRWLEDDNSTETAAWVAEQNKVTFSYLDTIPYRAKLKERLEALYNYPKFSAPFRRGDLYFYTKNDGLQNQSVYYVQKGLNGNPEVLMDPNKLSSDGTTRLAMFSVSRDGKYVGYGISKGGSDWEEFHVMEIAGRKTLPDTIQWVKVSGLAWQGDGFYYSRYPAPEKGHELSTKNENHEVWFHRVGTDQSQDQLVYRDSAHPQRFHNVTTSDDEKYSFLTISDRATGKMGNSLFFKAAGSREFTPLVSEVTNSSYRLIDAIGSKFYIETNAGAPNGKVVVVDAAHPEASNWKEILPEKPEPLQSASIAGGKLFGSYLKDVTTRTYVYDLNGKLENEVTFPGPGAAGGFGGNLDDKEVFYTFSSFNYPPTIFKYAVASKKSEVFRTPQIPGFKASDYETKEVFYPSKDGTKVPMFLTYKKGLKLDGNNPTLLYAYGGFNITTSPSFSSLRLALLENGFVYASANIRGGSEYGEKWHEAGTKLKKQNVFDDFIAAAEWLIANKYTSSEKLSIQGGSNGGLLVGAVMNQRPELFKVALPAVGVMDMLRFHKFTIGWNWIADYGSSDNPAEFKALHAYSPLHNIRSGVKYPATFITTADHDDRVVPAHSFKYAATLQEKAAAGARGPLLIRIETKSGHGASSTAKQLEITADTYAFVFENLGIKPKY